MFYISVLALIALLVYRFVNHCSQNKESCHLPKMFSQPIWNPDTSQGFASIITRFSFSRFSFSYSSFSCFYSFAFLYLAFILSVNSCFSFYAICLFFYQAHLLFCPLQALCLDIKNPLPGSLLQEGIRFPYGSCLLHLVCCSFPIALAIVLCICSLRIALTFLFFLIALAQISGQTCLLLAVLAPSLRTWMSP